MVCGNLVARFQQHDVAGNQGRAVHRHPPPVAQDSGARRQHLPDGRHGGFSLALLQKADHRIGQNHCQDHPGVDPVLQGAGDHRSANQDIDQHVVELHQESAQRPARLSLGQAVWTVRGQPLGRLGCGQPARAGLQVGKAIGGEAGMRIGHLHQRAV